MRISDWSSDVCSSDLGAEVAQLRLGVARLERVVDLRRPAAQRLGDGPIEADGAEGGEAGLVGGYEGAGRADAEDGSQLQEADRDRRQRADQLESLEHGYGHVVDGAGVGDLPVPEEVVLALGQEIDVDLELGEQGGALGEALRASVLPRPGERLLQRLAELLAVVVPLGLFDAEHQPVDEPIGLGAQRSEGVAAGALERLPRDPSYSSGPRSDIRPGPGLPP